MRDIACAHVRTADRRASRQASIACRLLPDRRRACSTGSKSPDQANSRCGLCPDLPADSACSLSGWHYCADHAGRLCAGLAHAQQRNRGWNTDCTSAVCAPWGECAGCRPRELGCEPDGRPQTAASYGLFRWDLARFPNTCGRSGHADQFAIGKGPRRGHGGSISRQSGCVPSFRVADRFSRFKRRVSGCRQPDTPACQRPDRGVEPEIRKHRQ